MSTTEHGQDVPQPAEAQSAQTPESPRESPANRSRSDRALPWAQLGVGLLCAGTGTIVGLSGHPELGAAIAGGVGINVTVNIDRQ